jgi:hypothetical protein
MSSVAEQQSLSFVVGERKVVIFRVVDGVGAVVPLIGATLSLRVILIEPAIIF